ncbi:MAG: N-formylglutamate deformylase [Betaproteobacteria bacterium]
MSQAWFGVHRGTTPLVVSLPHCGRQLPDELRARLVDAALAVPDTDWHLDRLYGFVRDAGASLIVPRLSRYVIDLNRPPEDAPMYPGANNTGLCPTRAFTGEPIYRPGQEPDAAEIARRRDAYWRPYHDALAAELERVRARHGHAVLFDGHSIKSELPWLFEGRLADLNLGSAGGASCAPSLRAALAGVLAAQARFSHVVDGRFKGGHITRHYGRPREGVHAVQLEMAWRCYCADEARPEDWSDAAAERVRPLLRTLVATMIGWKPA